LEILIGSDDNNKEITKNLALHWAKDRDKILAVIGHNAGNASLPAAGIYEEFKLPMISPTTYVELPPENRYTFRMQPSTFKVADMLVGYANQTFAKQTIAGCVDKESKDNSDFEKHFKEQAYGAKFTYLEGKCNIDGKNIEQKIRTLKEQGVTVIVIAPFVNELDRSFKFARAAQKANLKILGTPSFYLQPTLNHPEAMEGLVMPVAWMPYLPERSNSAYLPGAIKTPENTAFYRQALKIWKLPTTAYAPAITWRSAMAYDATYVLTEAIDHLEKPDRETIQTFIQNTSIQGTTGEITFDSGGSRKKPKEGVMVSVQRRNKTPQIEFVPIAPPQK
jgi:branched-chain amino acid transport system substrate-binding protein